MLLVKLVCFVDKFKENKRLPMLVTLLLFLRINFIAYRLVVKLTSSYLDFSDSLQIKTQSRVSNNFDSFIVIYFSALFCTKVF